MPAWNIHRKWSKQLNIPISISESIDRLVDFPKEWFEDGYPWMTYEDILLLDEKELHSDVCFEAFSELEKNNLIVHDLGRHKPLNPTQKELLLECIYHHYGTLGIKAFFLHHVLDYIDESWLPYSKTKMREIFGKTKAIFGGTRFDNELFAVISFVEKHWDEIVKDIKGRSPEEQEALIVQRWALEFEMGRIINLMSKRGIIDYKHSRIDISPPPERGKNGWVCPICGKEFPSLDILIRHIEKIHRKRLKNLPVS